MSDASLTPSARTERLVVETVEDEVLVYDLDRDEAHSLDRAAAAVWRACDGRRDVAELASVVGAELGKPPSQELIWSALGRLEECHLLAGEAGCPMPGPDLSRRQALVRIGATGAAAGLALPVIKSIVAPDPAAAGSVACSGPGIVCGTVQSGSCLPNGVSCCNGCQMSGGATDGSPCMCG